MFVHLRIPTTPITHLTAAFALSRPRSGALLSAGRPGPDSSVEAFTGDLLLARGRLIALAAQPSFPNSFPNGAGILGRVSLLGRAERGSLAECAAGR
jgi:hypothetical protein